VSYNVVILRRAQKDLALLPVNVYESVKIKIYTLSDNPRPIGCTKLKGREAWRIRMGKYRIIYEIDDERKMVKIFQIHHHRDV